MEDLTMEQWLEQYDQMNSEDVYSGDVITGVIVRIKADEVLVDVNGKSEGVIPRNELSFQKNVNPEDVVAVGQELKLKVVKKENADGNMVLSKRRVDQEEAMEKLEAAYKEGTPVEAKVVDVVKGGVIVDIGARGFVPASQLDTRFIEDVRQFVGQTLSFKIIEFEMSDRKKKIVLSRRVLLEQEEKVKKEQVWSGLEDGQTRRGVVRRLTNFGAFVDLGGVDGLLHVSEMGWGKIRRPQDVVAVGEEVEVYVLSADQATGKISLGLKQLIENPWANIAGKYPVGTVVVGEVVRLAPFGAFVALEDGVDGLVHISQISWDRVEKVADVLSIGQKVETKVLEVDGDTKKVSLSMKELMERPVREKTVTEDGEEEKVELVEEQMNATLADVFKA